MGRGQPGLTYVWRPNFASERKPLCNFASTPPLEACSIESSSESASASTAAAATAAAVAAAASLSAQPSATRALPPEEEGTDADEAARSGSSGIEPLPKPEAGS